MFRSLSFLQISCELRSLTNTVLKCRPERISGGLITSGCNRLLHVERTKRMHCSFRFCAKGFVEYENQFAHHIMEANPFYSKTLFLDAVDASPVEVQSAKLQEIVTKDWTVESPTSVYKAFESVSLMCEKSDHVITDKAFDNLCASLIAKKSQYSDAELSGILRCLSLWPQTESLNSRNFVNVWSAFDKECVVRLRGWDNEKLLYFADHWYALHLSRVSDFVWNCLRRLGTKLHRLTPTQVVQLMFYTNVCRKINPATSVFELEDRIDKCIEHLTVDEVAIIAMGFFKTQTRIRNANITAQMIQRTTDDVDTINEIALTALMKAFRISLPLAHTDLLYYLLDRLVPNISRLSLLCCVHIALAGTNSQMLHEKLLQTISQRFANEIESLRIKDIERFAFALTLFDYDPKTNPCIYKTITAELSNPGRKEEIEKYPRCLASCLHYLTLKNIYEESLISQVLDEEYLKRTYGKTESKIGREILCLDTGVALECPNYSGNRLTSKLRHTLGKTFIQWVPTSSSQKKISATDTMMLDVKETVDNILGGPHFAYLGNILPNFQRADIVFGLLVNAAPVEIPSNFESLPAGDVKYPPVTSDQVTWHCVVIGGWNCYVRSSDKPLGGTAAKMRQLALLGYKTTLIPWFEWRKLPTSLRQAYIENYVFNS